MLERETLVDQVWLGGEQFIERQVGMTAEAEVDDPQPEPGHGVVVAVGAAGLGGEVPDPVGDRIGCALQAEPADLDPGKPEMVPMVEILVGNPARMKGIDERVVLWRYSGSLT